MFRATNLKQCFNRLVLVPNRSMSSNSFTASTLKLNHTCLRVKDPKVSVEHYTKHYGLKLIDVKKVPERKFDLYFLAFSKDAGHPFDRQGVLELTHNYGTEKQDSFRINNGNEEPHRGFGHICFAVENIKQYTARLAAEGVRFQKTLEQGRQRDIAFALDPDGYWVELIQKTGDDSSVGTEYDSSSRFNHTMVRVKDITRSLQFYREVLGLKLLQTKEFPEAKFSLYFLGYQHDSGFVENGLTGATQAHLEGILELTHNWGTEKEDTFSYHNGNDEPQGYGHIGISVDNAEAFCAHLEKRFSSSLNWALKYNQGFLKHIAFLKDPDGYSIEILPSGFDF